MINDNDNNIYYKLIKLMENYFNYISNDSNVNLYDFYEECFSFFNILSKEINLENHLKEFGSYNYCIIIIGKFIRIVQFYEEYDKIKYNAQLLLDYLNN